MLSGGRNMGRGGGGGGGSSLLRTVGRAVTGSKSNLRGGTHIPESISSPSSSRHVNSTGSSSSSSSSNGNNHLSASSPFASCNVPVSTVHGLPAWRSCDELDWVSVDNGLERSSSGFVLGSVPSEDEVYTAVSALQQVFIPDSYTNLIRDKFGSELVNYDEEHQITSPSEFAQSNSPPGSEIDWIEPSLCMCNSRTIQCHGSERVYDALRLLRTEPLVQKMVKSLSSDEAVWNAVLSNEVVRELRESLSADDDGDKSLDENNKDSGEDTNIVKLIFDGTRAKIMEVVDKITRLMNDLFQIHEDRRKASTAAGGADSFMEKLRSSFMLSVIVLLVVVLARAHKA